MAYIGENKYFSFRDNFGEALGNIGSTETAKFGMALASIFNRIFVGSDRFEHMNVLYALCGGISDCGKEVYMCENTDLPSFQFGIPLISADCGIFISKGSLKLSFFDKSGVPLSDTVMEQIMNALPSERTEKCGKINSMTSFRGIYINNIADSLKVNSPIPASISCGNKSIRSLWLKFFTGEWEKLVFQVSDDGQRVNAYSAELGFISHEKLALAYAVKLMKSNKNVLLPNNFHYMADYLGIKRTALPTETYGKQRFLHDCLYMCVSLACDMDYFYDIVKSLPEMVTVKRDVAVKGNVEYSENPIESEKGRVIVTKSGKNRLSVLAQSYSTETASEICSEWIKKLSEKF